MDYILSELLGLAIFSVPLLLVIAVATALGLFAFHQFSKDRSLSDLLLLGTVPGCGFSVLMALLFWGDFQAITERYPFSMSSLSVPAILLMLLALWLFRNRTVEKNA